MITNCPHCTQSIEADDQMEGMTVNCPTCQKEFILPRLSAPPVLGGQVPVRSSDTVMIMRSRSRKSNVFSMTRIIIICVTVLAGLWIWKGGNHIVTIKTADGETIRVNVSAIQALIKQDKELGEEMSSAQTQIDPKTNEGLDQYSRAIRDYVAKAKQLDTSDCPRDFAEAYFRHLSAWSNEADAIDAHPQIQSEGEAIFEGMLRGLAGDPTGGAIQKKDEYDEWFQRVKNANDAVRDSWNEVEALEVRYGAK